VADDDASFGHVWVLDVLEFDELLFEPDEFCLDELDELGDGVDDAAQAWPMPSPPRTAPVATVVATSALRILGTTARSPPSSRSGQGPGAYPSSLADRFVEGSRPSRPEILWRDRLE